MRKTVLDPVGSALGRRRYVARASILGFVLAATCFTSCRKAEPRGERSANAAGTTATPSGAVRQPTRASKTSPTLKKSSSPEIAARLRWLPVHAGNLVLLGPLSVNLEDEVAASEGAWRILVHRLSDDARDRTLVRPDTKSCPQGAPVDYVQLTRPLKASVRPKWWESLHGHQFVLYNGVERKCTARWVELATEWSAGDHNLSLKAKMDWQKPATVMAAWQGHGEHQRIVGRLEVVSGKCAGADWARSAELPEPRMLAATKPDATTEAAIVQAFRKLPEWQTQQAAFEAGEDGAQKSAWDGDSCAPGSGHGDAVNCRFGGTVQVVRDGTVQWAWVHAANGGPCVDYNVGMTLWARIDRNEQSGALQVSFRGATSAALDDFASDDLPVGLEGALDLDGDSAPAGKGELHLLFPYEHRPTGSGVDEDGAIEWTDYLC